jgi:hypothetical protein
VANAFISYSHRDEKALERLHTHLATLRRDGKITAWYDREILAGDNLDSTIDKNLALSDIFLALVSPDFLASNYCYEREMAIALERHAKGTLRVVPIILEPCDWKSTPLGELKALPKDGKAISIWTNENVAYLDVIMELRRITSESRSAIKGDVSEAAASAPNREPRRYRIKKEFDSIDRGDFRQKSFLAIQEFFRISVDELNQVSDLIRSKFERLNELAFSCTVLNKANGREAHITIRADTDHTFREDISYSFSKRSPANTANGFISIQASEYELYLRLDNFSSRSRDRQASTVEQVAEELWRQFTAQAGIDHE